MTMLADVKRALVAEAAEDFLGFWLVLAFVRDDLGIKDKPADRELTLEIVRELLTEGLLAPGFPIDQGPEFDAWDLPVDEAMARFEASWDDLDEDPFAGDIVWFIATPKGRGKALRSYIVQLKDRDVSIEQKKQIYSSLLRMAGELEDWAWYLEDAPADFKESDIDWEKIAELETGLEREEG